MRRHPVAVIAGDGIGPEVVGAALAVLGAASRRFGFGLDVEQLPYSADHYLATRETIPDAAVDHLRNDVDAIFVGALGDPRVPGNEHARDILLGLRFRLDLYVNLRPVTLLHPSLCPLRDLPSGAPRAIDFAIFRENTEGIYVGAGGGLRTGTPDEVQLAEEVHTRKGVERIIRAAFEWAKANGRTRVTMSDKSNAVPAHRLWGRVFAEVGAEYPGIEREHRYVDALAMELVREPERFQAIVTQNLFGDILSDLAAQLVGGLGISPSANLHPGRAGLFEPVHGSAPPMAGKNVANPFAAILTGAMMVRELRYPEAATALEDAVRAAVAAGMTTPDLGGTAGTREVTRWIAERVAH
ncbi:MAG TPA: isocitrate/isopropylmalate dehydrogenase family protein [Gemmatimonadales bacterium]|nr:isocitrate/isopropylmalate dehydrogenase family protein [Gemmatimonadales bacterium]